MVAVQAATSLLKAHRTHGHLAARLDPLGREPEGDPALDPEPLGLTPELMAKIPAHILRMYVPGATLADALPHLRETYCGTIAYEIEHIASHRQRLWLREAIESGTFRKPLTNAEQKALLKRLTEVDALRALHAQGLPGPEAVLGRGPGHDRADARRAHPAVGHPGRAGGGDRDGPSRPSERAGPQPGTPRTRRSSPSSRAPRRWSRSPPCPRAAPATSSTTTAPRAPTSCPAASRSSSAWSQIPATSSSWRRSRPERPGPPRPPARARTPTRTPTPPCR